MNKRTITSFAIILLILVPLISNGAESYKPFIQEQYPSNEFKISKSNIRHGDVLIKIIEAKRTSKKYEESPHLCRTWLTVKKSSKTIFTQYIDDIDAVGFSYGLFIPQVQPPSPYFAVMKNGDYNGRLFIVRKDGKVFDLMGGFYFITKNKRYIFSEYASDSSGLAVFDLQSGRVVFSSVALPAEMNQWYERNGTYFFTGQEGAITTVAPGDDETVAYFYDFKSNKITEKIISKSELAASKSVPFDFDPREHEDCDVTKN